jgi:hypothetical protein
MKDNGSMQQRMPQFSLLASDSGLSPLSLVRLPEKMDVKTGYNGIKASSNLKPA